MRKWIYEFLYRFPFVPIEWIFGSSSEMENLLDLAIDGRIAPGRAITLGCGVGRETIYLAKKGFDVIGVDFSATAIKRARRKAQAEGVEVRFVEDDVTNLTQVNGTFDLTTDFGAINDINQEARDLYMQNLLPLTYPGSYYLMFCFNSKLPFDEVEQRFSKNFSIETQNKSVESGFPSGITLYLMTRK